MATIPDDLLYTPDHEYIKKTGDPAIVVIGITDYDIESTSLGIQHMFSFRDSQRYAVVSSAQIGANGFDRVRGHSRHERVRKLVAREIGFLYLKRGETTDPHSLTRPMMWRLHDIDALREAL